MDHKDYRLAAIMYTDIVGFSRMMESDEVGTLKLMEFHNQLVKKQVDEFGGKIIKTIGDAFLIEFPNANNAVRCSIAVQKELEALNATKPKTPLVLRIGVHLGDIYFFENDALGEGINIASRLQSLCRPGRVCISGEVHTLVSKKIELPIQPLGAVQLKNISRGITAYEVLTNGAAEEPPAEPETPIHVDDPTLTATPVPAPELPRAVPPAAPAMPAGVPAGSDPQALRAFVFQTIKQTGRRLSVDEMRLRLPAEQQGAAADAYLESLADSGFLVRSNPAAGSYGSARPGPGSSTESSVYGDWRSRDHDRDRYGSGHPRDEFRAVGREIRDEIRHEIRQAVRNGVERSRGPSYEQYMEQVDRRLEREENGFRSHLISFAAVNAGLVMIWAVTSLFGPFWPLFPILGWGIGLASHWGTLRDRKREAGQLKAMPSLDQKQFGIVRKLFKERRGWNGHLISTVAVSALLLGTNLFSTIVSGGAFFGWSIIPIAAMAIGVFSHLPVFKRKEEEFLNQLSADGLPIEALTTPQDYKKLSAVKLPADAGPIAAEAERVRQRILRQVKGMQGANPLGDDFEAVLENYVVQIRELASRDREIDSILATLPVRDLEAERAHLERELASCTDERMRVEYEKSLSQIDKQRTAFGEMVSEQKVLKLRLNNALNSLKQLEIDLARMRSLASGANVEAQAAIKSKSDELTQFLNDLRAGYSELDNLEAGVADGTTDNGKPAL